MAKFIKGLLREELSACDKAGSFLQSGFWGGFKARFGWEALAFSAEWECDVSMPLLVLRRSLAPGVSLAYVPWGPELPAAFDNDEARPAILAELAGALKETLPANTVFIRFDPPWYGEKDDSSSPGFPPPFVRAGADVQPPDTVLVYLSQPMESILERMKPKWRYNARLAIKKGVTVRQAGAEEIEVFYGLLEETARRDGLAIHGIGYYRTLFESDWYDGSMPDIRLYLAEHEGDVLAGIVTLFRGWEAVYLYGASADKKRNLMAAYALQVKAMEDARASGCSEYDLFGIAPSGDPSHPMAGLYLFKTGFGGRIIHRPGSWDYPCRPLLYRVFRLAEKARKYLMTLKKRRPHNDNE